MAKPVSFASKALVWMAALFVATAADVRSQHVASAQEDPQGGLRAAVAYFDVDGDHATTALEATYYLDRWRLWRVRPQVGGMANMDGALYGYGGIVLPLEGPGGLLISPSFSAGAYRQGNSLDLGSVLEFRSGIQLELPVGDRAGVGLFLYHLSNASIGDRNPGTEVLGLGYVLRW